MTHVDMSNLPSSQARDLLSLTLAGVFRDAAEEGIGGGVRREDTVEMSSENSGPGKSRSDDDCEAAAEEEPLNFDDDDEDENDGGKKKKRKKYHRHTPEQIREMESLFKESPHPDEKQRLQLSKQLGLHPRQVKFWFQNRRTQIKAVQERHENSLLKFEIEKLHDENKSLRESIKNQTCPKCGFTSPNSDTVSGHEDQKLRIENARLKAEIEKLKSSIEKTSPHTCSSYPSSNDHENRSSCKFYNGNFGLEKTGVMDAVNRAVDELTKMATHGEPLWIRSYETGREILNYDEYRKEFDAENQSSMQPKKSIEASRESALIFVDLHWLVQTFMDADQWKELFPCLISKAATVDVISNGSGSDSDGAAHLMFAEIQMLTPLVATREVYFVRYSKKISAHRWAIVDLSLDNINPLPQKCRKRPSGCIIEDKSNGHCKVTFVEHLECKRSAVHYLYRNIVNTGQAFGAKRWLSTLQQQCDRLVFLVATNVPTKDSSGVATLAGRKSLLKLAERMNRSFCRALGGSSFNSWNKITTKDGDEIRVATRKNQNEPGEPLGMILCAVSSLWLPVSHHVLFDFLRDETRRNEWDIMSKGSKIQTIANLAKGQDRGNAVTTMEMQKDDHKMWVLQDSSTNAYESMVVYAPVEINGLQEAMTGCDSSNIPVLPSGFIILPDGIESRNLVITSRAEEKSEEGGSLLTMAFQILISKSSTTKLCQESVDSVNNLISCTVEKIKSALQCED